MESQHCKSWPKSTGKSFRLHFSPDFKKRLVSLGDVDKKVPGLTFRDHFILLRRVETILQGEAMTKLSDFKVTKNLRGPLSFMSQFKKHWNSISINQYIEVGHVMTTFYTCWNNPFLLFVYPVDSGRHIDSLLPQRTVVHI